MDRGPCDLNLSHSSATFIIVPLPTHYPYHYLFNNYMGHSFTLINFQKEIFIPYSFKWKPLP